MHIFLDRRYWIYHAFITTVITCLLARADILEGEDLQAADLFFDMVIFFVGVSTISVASRYVVKLLNRFMPWETALFKRFITESLIVVGLVIMFAASITLVVVAVEGYDHKGDLGVSFEFLTLIMITFTVFCVFAFHEFMTLSSDKASLKFRAEALQKQNQLARYDALRSQVSPHFLFNSLNVLSGLIHLDAHKSDQFVKKFSQVFRYVLELNQEKLVPVKNELEFLDAYLFLQKIRYGTSLEIHRQISPDILNMYIPPLSLQLVIENALKHNVISESLKMNIYLETGDDEIIVRNNYQHRDSVNGSTGVGQKNLSEKYALLAGKAPQFYVENGFYFTRLPVLANALWNEY